MVKQWHFFDKVYRAWVCLVICEPDDFVEFIRLGGYKDIDSVPDMVIGQGCMLRIRPEDNDVGNNCTILWLRKWHTPTLVHELSHLTSQILTDCLVPIDHNNTEVVAFYTEFWWTEVNRTRRKFPNGNRPKDVK